MLMVLERVLVSLLMIMVIFHQLNITTDEEMELQKFLGNPEKSTGGKMKMTKEKAIDKIYILMDLPTMVNIIMVKCMVMELPRIS